jgi:DnaK suppressor protein
MDEGTRSRLVDELRSRERGLIEAGNVAIDPARSDAVAVPEDDQQPLTEMSQAIASSRNRERTTELALVHAALRKATRDPEDFGLCEACEEAIAARRLELLPWARFCIRCKGAREDPVRGRRRHAGDLD